MENAQLNLDSHPTPVVSVAITAYNSAKWLPRALDSVLQQSTNFPFEIVISDDCSQDDTVQIARSYSDLHPGLLRVVERSINVGMQRNYYETFDLCRGKFIAWLDADDYWTDPQKLNIQVDILESDSTVSMCCHCVCVVTGDGQVKDGRSPSLPAGRYGVGDILHQNIVSTPSAMFRNGIQRQLPDWYFDLAPVTDWPIWVLAALSGDILLLDRVMGDYMLTPGSSHSSKGPLFAFKADARFYEHVESVLPGHWHRLVRNEKGKRYESIAYLLRKQGDFVGSRQAAFKAFSSPFLLDNFGSKSKSLLAAVIRETQWRLRGRRTAANESQL
ncbi:MAG: glycosyltransferase [Acidobacteriota bacterium]|nr:glycosyltransferase [Acidobacteriota bacterium]